MLATNSGCKSLNSIDLPNSLTRIGEYAFDGCKSIYSVDVPSSVTSTGRFAFPHHIQKNSQPEICRKFLGLTLGVTTKQQAISKLLEQQVDILLNSKKSLYVGNVSHDGIHFGSAFLEFYDGVFSQILFNENSATEDKQISQSKLKQIKDFYTQKYGAYKYFCFEPHYCTFDDDVTKLTVIDKGLFFSDCELSEQSDKAKAERYREIHPYADTRIEKTVLGCTLGASTKQQVIDALGAFNIRVVEDCSPDSIVFSPVKHEGVDFSVLTAKFFAGKLDALTFSNPGKGLTRSEFDALKVFFSAKYPEYDRSYDPGYEDVADKASYFDDIVTIYISQGGYVGLLPGGLFYQDHELYQKDMLFELRSLRGQKTIDSSKQNIADFFKTAMEKLATLF